MEATKTNVHAFIIYMLDYAKSLLYGLRKRYYTSAAKNTQNNAARVIT